MLKQVMRLITGLLAANLMNDTTAADFSYEAISQRHQSSALNAATVGAAIMQGECMVGLKKLNFKKSDNFNPGAEWSSFRSISLLKRYPPCEVLIIMGVARSTLQKESTPKPLNP